MNWYHVRPHDGYGWKVESFPDVRPHQEVRVRRMVDMPDAAERLEPGPMIIMWSDPDRQYGTVFGRHEWLQFDTSGAANTWIRQTEAELSALDAPPPFLVIVEASNEASQNRLAMEQEHETFEQRCFQAGLDAYRQGRHLHTVELPSIVPTSYNEDSGRHRILSGYMHAMREHMIELAEGLRLERERAGRRRRRGLVNIERIQGVDYGRSPDRTLEEGRRRRREENRSREPLPEPERDIDL